MALSVSFGPSVQRRLHYRSFVQLEWCRSLAGNPSPISDRALGSDIGKQTGMIPREPSIPIYWLTASALQCMSAHGGRSFVSFKSVADCDIISLDSLVGGAVEPVSSCHSRTSAALDYSLSEMEPAAWCSFLVKQ